MIKNELFKGYFFLPDFPDTKIAGELKFNCNNNIRLELYGAFFQSDDDYRNAKSEVAIWGISVNNELLTLIHCDIASRGSRWERSGSKTYTVVYSAEIIFKGIHLSNINSAHFFEIEVDFEGLNEWIRAPYAQVTPSDNFKRFDIKYEQPDDVVFKIDDRFHGEFSFSHLLPTSESFSLKPHCSCKIRSYKSESFIDYKSALWKIQSMISFLTMSKVQVTSIKLYSIESVFKYNEEVSIPNEIIVLFIQPENHNKEIKPYNFLLFFEDIFEHFEDILRKWIEIQSEVTPIMQILHNQLGDDNNFSQRNFLDIVQGVEAYHRRKLQDNTKLKQPDKIRKEEIFRQLSSKDDIDWLKAKLAYSYEPSLRERLKEMFSLCDIILFHNPNEESIKKLIGHIVNTRNYYTHYDKSLENKRLKLKSLFSVSLALRNLLIIMILKELGMAENVIKSSIKGNLKFTLPPQYLKSMEERCSSLLSYTYNHARLHFVQ